MLPQHPSSICPFYFVLLEHCHVPVDGFTTVLAVLAIKEMDLHARNVKSHTRLWDRIILLVIHDRRKCPKATRLHAEQKERELKLGLVEPDLDEAVHVIELVVLLTTHLLTLIVMLFPTALSG